MTDNQVLGSILLVAIFFAIVGVFSWIGGWPGAMVGVAAFLVVFAIVAAKALYDKS